MSATSTSDLRSDYARDIVEHFVERRAHGTAISSADQQLLADWEARGVPLFCVLEGLDRAFERRREPPRALAHCRRWVHAAWRAWAAEDVEDAEAARPIAPPTDAGHPRAPDDASSVEPASLADRARELIRVELAVARAPEVREALATLAAEVEEIVADEGVLDAITAASLDEALAELVLDGCDAGARASLEADIRLEERIAAEQAASPADAARRVASAPFEVISRRFRLRSLVARL